MYFTVSPIMLSANALNESKLATGSYNASFRQPVLLSRGASLVATARGETGIRERVATGLYSGTTAASKPS